MWPQVKYLSNHAEHFKTTGAILYTTPFYIIDWLTKIVYYKSVKITIDIFSLVKVIFEW